MRHHFDLRLLDGREKYPILLMVRSYLLTDYFVGCFVHLRLLGSWQIQRVKSSYLKTMSSLATISLT